MPAEIAAITEFRPFAEQTYLNDPELPVGDLFAEIAKFFRTKKSSKIKVFISYAWPILEVFPDEFWVQAFLLNLRMHLQKMGITALLDLTDSRFGPSSREYMQREMAAADCILLIGTRSLKSKITYTRYFGAAVRIEYENIVERIRNYAEQGKRYAGVVPLQLNGAHVSDIFTGDFIGQSTIESLQKDAYLHFLEQLSYAIYRVLTGRNIANCFAGTDTSCELSNIWRRARQDKQLGLLFTPTTWIKSKHLYEKLQQQAQETTEKQDDLVQQIIDRIIISLDPVCRGDAQIVQKIKDWQPDVNCRPVPETPEPTPPRAISYNLPQVDSLVIERTQWLIQLETALQTSSKKIVVTGLGGSGKTTLVSQFLAIKQTVLVEKFKVMAFFNAETLETLQSEISSFCKAQQAEDYATQTLPNLQKSLLSILHTLDPALIVLDNVENFSLLDNLLAVDFPGKIIITTRDSMWVAHDSQKISLGLLSAEECRAIVALQLGSDSLTAEAIAALASNLGGLPLAIAQAARYIRENQMSIAEFNALYQTERAVWLSRSRAVVGSALHAPLYPMIGMLLTKIAAIEEIGTITVELLKIISLFAPESVPKNMLFYATQLKQKVIFQEVLHLMLMYGLVSCQTDDQQYGTVYSMHRVFQDVLKCYISESERISLSVKAYKALTIERTCTTNRGRDYLCLLRLQPHFESFYRHYRQFYANIDLVPAPTFEDSFAWFLYNLGHLYSWTNQYESAEKIGLEALACHNKFIKPEQPVLFRWYVLYLLVRAEIGLHKNSAAAAYLAETLDLSVLISTQKNEPNSAERSSTLGLAGGFYAIQGDLQRMIEAHTAGSAIAIENLLQDKTQGDWFRRMNYAVNQLSLAQVDFYRGRFQQARVYYQEALEISVKTSGIYSQDIAQIHTAFGRFCLSLENFAEAEEHLLAAVRDWGQKKVSLPPHTVAFAFYLLHILYQAQRHSAVAAEYLEKTLTLQCQLKKYDEQNQAVLSRFVCETNLLHKTGQIERAKVCCGHGLFLYTRLAERDVDITKSATAQQLQQLSEQFVVPQIRRY